jgi:hypothetical protein
MEVIFVSDGGETSQEQWKHLQAIARRFPNLEIREYGADSEEAARWGIIRAPGVVVQGVVLGIGQVISAGKLRRFIERFQKRTGHG